MAFNLWSVQEFRGFFCCFCLEFAWLWGWCSAPHPAQAIHPADGPFLPPTDTLHPQTHHLPWAPLEIDGSTQSPCPHLPQLGWAPAHPTHRQGWWGKWRYTRWGTGWAVPVDRNRGQQAPAVCGHPPLCTVICISKATVTIVSAPSFKNRSTMSKQAL